MSSSNVDYDDPIVFLLSRLGTALGKVIRTSWFWLVDNVDRIWSMLLVALDSPGFLAEILGILPMYVWYVLFLNRVQEDYSVHVLGMTIPMSITTFVIIIVLVTAAMMWSFLSMGKMIFRTIVFAVFSAIDRIAGNQWRSSGPNPRLMLLLRVVIRLARIVVIISPLVVALIALCMHGFMFCKVFMSMLIALFVGIAAISTIAKLPAFVYESFFPTDPRQEPSGIEKILYWIVSVLRIPLFLFFLIAGTMTLASSVSGIASLISGKSVHVFNVSVLEQPKSFLQYVFRTLLKPEAHTPHIEDSKVATQPVKAELAEASLVKTPLVCPERKVDAENQSIKLRIGEEIPCECVEGCSPGDRAGTYEVSPRNQGSPMVTLRAAGTPSQVLPEGRGDKGIPAIAGTTRIVSPASPFSMPARTTLTENWVNGACFGTTEGKIQPSDNPTVMQFAATGIELSEDRWFLCHAGVNPYRVVRALFNTVVKGRTEGGSTITMQLAKLEYTNSAQTIGRKLLDLVNAGIMEWQYTKPEIMEKYLTRIPLGHGTVGIQNGAQFYFKAELSTLTMKQAAMLISLVSSPAIKSPYSSSGGINEKKDIHNELCPSYAPSCDSMLSRVYKMLSRMVRTQKTRWFYPTELSERVIRDVQEAFREPGYSPELGYREPTSKPLSPLEAYAKFVKDLGLRERKLKNVTPGWYASRCYNHGDKQTCYAAHDDGYHYRGKNLAKNRPVREISEVKESYPLYDFKDRIIEGQFASEFVITSAREQIRDRQLILDEVPASDIEAYTTIIPGIQKPLQDAVSETLRKEWENPDFKDLVVSAVVMGSDGSIKGAFSLAPPDADGNPNLGDHIYSLNRPIGSCAKIHVYGAAAGVTENLLAYKIPLSLAGDLGLTLPKEHASALLGHKEVSVWDALCYSSNPSAVVFLGLEKASNPLFCDKMRDDFLIGGYSLQQSKDKIWECKIDTQSFALGAKNWSFLAEMLWYASIANGGTKVDPWVVTELVNLRPKSSGTRPLQQQSRVDVRPRVKRTTQNAQRALDIREMLRPAVGTPRLGDPKKFHCTLGWVPKALKQHSNLSGLFVGGKTGTAGGQDTVMEGSTDAWTFLIVGQVVIGVWVGTLEFSGIKKNLSTNIPSKILQSFFRNCKIDLSKVQPYMFD